MTITLKDLERLRWHLLAALGALIAAALLVWWSLQFQTHTERELRQTQNRAQAAERRLQQVRSEEEEIRDKTALYVALRDAGVIGAERRLDWTEALGQRQHLLRLPGLEYEFAPQTALDASESTAYRYYRSAMKLQVKLGHEEDLLRLIQSLERGVSALVITRSCRIFRPTGGEDTKSTLATRLEASCDMDWVTANKLGGR